MCIEQEKNNQIMTEKIVKLLQMTKIYPEYHYYKITDGVTIHDEILCDKNSIISTLEDIRDGLCDFINKQIGEIKNVK